MDRKRKGLFIAATGQNVGKTTLCLGLISLLKKRNPKLGVIKPVGQQHLEMEDGVLVDKDVVLFKQHFSLPFSYQSMSPVIFPKGFTRDFLDNKISNRDLLNRIHDAYNSIAAESHFTLVEGTGHVGVGTIVDLNNAKVAKELGLDMVIISKGGIGSAIDELALNISLCEAMGVNVSGVILNRVLESKIEMVTNYVSKALSKWGIPLLGAIPYSTFLNTPTMKDFSSLFAQPLLAGEDHDTLHFSNITLALSAVAISKDVESYGQLLVTPATREDILYSLIESNAYSKQGLILTGRHPPSSDIINQLRESNIPTLYIPLDTFTTMQKINSFTAKIQVSDTMKIERAISLVETHLDLSIIL